MSKDIVCYIIPGLGFLLTQLDEVVGRKAKQTIEKNRIIYNKDLVKII